MNPQTAVAVHPAAEAYRLMTDEELSALAADIAANGQHDAIILGAIKGSTERSKIIDGRNRANACEIAGVVPKFETREFEDEAALRAFVKSRSERRDLTKGQRAMGVALLFPKPEKGGRGHKKERVEETSTFSAKRLQQARTVLAYSRDLALAVRDGTESLDDVYEMVMESRKALESTEALIARLRTEAPDLAVLLAEERLKLAEAIAALDKRVAEAAAEEKSKRDAFLRLTEAAYRGTTSWADPAFVVSLRDRLADDEFRKELVKWLRFNPDEIAKIQAGAMALADVLGTLGDEK